MAQQPLSTVLAQFDTNIALVTSEVANPAGGGFQKCNYRFLMEKQPDGASEGLYFLDVPHIITQGPQFGNAETTYEAHVHVEVGYFRGGGDAGGGDRDSVQRNASDDAMRLADVLTRPVNYSGSTTGIREIRFLGAERTVDKPRAEIWSVRFWVQWRSDLITS